MKLNKGGSLRARPGFIDEETDHCLISRNVEVLYYSNFSNGKPT